MKERLTIHVPVDLVDRVKNAVMRLSGPPERTTLAGFAEAALEREVARLEKAHNGGQPFPARAAELRGGRPIK